MQYTVEAGDSLSRIARDVLGDISRWPEIAATNNLAAPYTITPGQVLTLPDPGTIQFGPATLAPAAPGAPAAAVSAGGAWWLSPWVWVVGAVGLYWLSTTLRPPGRRRPRRRRARARRPC